MRNRRLLTRGNLQTDENSELNSVFSLATFQNKNKLINYNNIKSLNNNIQHKNIPANTKNNFNNRVHGEGNDNKWSDRQIIIMHQPSTATEKNANKSALEKQQASFLINRPSTSKLAAYYGD